MNRVECIASASLDSFLTPVASECGPGLDVDVTMTQLHKKLQRLLALGPRIRLYLRRRGLKSFMRRATVKIARRLGRDIANHYLDWVEDHTPSASALAAQRRWARTAPDLPRFTLVLRPDAKMRTNLSRTLAHLAASNVLSLVHRGFES